ncbi:MAG: ATP-binding protein [Gammaproteobacteria bacterium]|nr:ATP-binding protein [Gammaproteobacteria bacterium]
MVVDNSTKTDRIQLINCSSECQRLYDFLADKLEPLPVSKEFRHDLKLVAEELLANIIRHGYDDESEQGIDIELSVDNDRVQLTFTDSGKTFNPMENEQPELLNDPSEGGMGILLVKSLTDAQHYKRDGDRNVFTVTKNYNQ